MQHNEQDFDVRLCAVFMCCLAASERCARPEAKGKKELLSVDFKQGQILRYKQVSEREVQLDFDPAHKISKDATAAVFRP